MERLHSMGGGFPSKTVYTTERENFWAKVEKIKHTIHKVKTLTVSVMVFVIIKQNGSKLPELNKCIKLWNISCIPLTEVTTLIKMRILVAHCNSSHKLLLHAQ